MVHIGELYEQQKACAKPGFDGRTCALVIRIDLGSNIVSWNHPRSHISMQPLFLKLRFPQASHVDMARTETGRKH